MKVHVEFIGRTGCSDVRMKMSVGLAKKAIVTSG
jgi:hypothetical protein